THEYKIIDRPKPAATQLFGCSKYTYWVKRLYQHKNNSKRRFMKKFKSIFFDMNQTLARDSHSARLSSQRVIPLIQARGLRRSADEIELIYRTVNTRHWEDFDQSPLAAIDCSLKARAVIWGEVLQTLGIDNPEF